ncbi:MULTISPECIES: hypothetical protein [unclassified Streptomyces]|uniref:SCO4402 family protein n=1 Tax=unclassified Streptomyces TaxID=2593676 RepID=UPI0037FE92CA
MGQLEPTQGIDLPAMRGEVISAVRDLSDRAYQQRVWIDKKLPNPNYLASLTQVINVLYDDTLVLEDPAATLGKILRSESEVSAMERLSSNLNALLEEVPESEDDRPYLMSPRWSSVVSSAEAALRELLRKFPEVP